MIIGGLLIALGLIGFVAGGADWSTKTALIPVMAGLPIVLLGALAAAKPGWLMHTMHVALLVAVFGSLATLFPIIVRVLPGKASGLAAFSLIGMFALCVTFIVVGVKSFIAARKARNAAGGSEVLPTN